MTAPSEPVSPKPITVYIKRHLKVRDQRGKAREHECAHCGGQAAHWATIHGRDGQDPVADYLPLCASCHSRYDWKPRPKRERVPAVPMQSYHLRVSDETGRRLRQMARIENRTITAQVITLIQRAWQRGNYGEDK